MPPLWVLALIFLLVPVAELYVIYQVGDAIGVLPTFALLVAASIAGSLLLRAQGRAVWRRFNATMQAGRIPQQEVMDGVLVIFGGAFLITPGFLTDIVGLALLVPPSRAFVRRLIARRLRARIVVAGSGRRVPPSGAEDEWVEGSAREVDSESPQLRR